MAPRDLLADGRRAAAGGPRRSAKGRRPGAGRDSDGGNAAGPIRHPRAGDSRPGHTPGSVAVLLDGGEAIVGDIVMRMFGRSARPGRPFVAWDLAMNEESVRRLAALNPHPVYAGHGGRSNLSDGSCLLDTSCPWCNYSGWQPQRHRDTKIYEFFVPPQRS